MNNFEFSDLHSHLLEQLQKHCTTSLNKTHWVLGCSGGVDSMTLAQLMLDLNIPLVLVHINYHKRGQDSEADQQLVELFARANHVACFCFDAPVFDQGNFQQLASDFRYEKFEQVRTQYKDALILTAHHANDQLESIAHHFFSGRSLFAPTGILTQKGKILRPLLKFTKAQLLDYALERGIPFREDASNHTLDFNRNYLRNRLFPELNQRYPMFQEALLRYQNEKNIAQLFTEQALQPLLNENKALKLSAFFEQPSPLLVPLFTSWLIQYANFSGKIPSDSTVKELIKQLQTAQEDWTHPLQQNIVLYKKGDLLHTLILPESNKPSKTSAKGIHPPTSYAIFHFDWAVPPQNLRQPSLLWVRAEKNDRISLTLPHTGQRFQPLGMKKGAKKVNDLLAEKGIPAPLKYLARVLMINDEPAALLFPQKTYGTLPISFLGLITEKHKLSLDSKIALRISLLTDQ